MSEETASGNGRLLSAKAGASPKPAKLPVKSDVRGWARKRVGNLRAHCRTDDWLHLSSREVTLRRSAEMAGPEFRSPCSGEMKGRRGRGNGGMDGSVCGSVRRAFGGPPLANNRNSHALIQRRCIFWRRSGRFGQSEGPSLGQALRRARQSRSCGSSLCARADDRLLWPRRDHQAWS